MPTSSLCHIERKDLPSMLSTLCCYENLFGPYHPHTLRLMAEAGLAFWRYGEWAYARPLLERAVRDLGRYLNPEHEARLRAITALRDLLLREGDHQRARAIQMELLECQNRRLGPEHPETVAARDELAGILLATLDSVPGRKI
jgi:eukaryotic-like serine/threonine-protein kinase